MISVTLLGPAGAMVGSPGGQGSVYELQARAGELLKIYHPQLRVDPAGLEALVAWRAGLPAQDRGVIDAATAWPRGVVDCGSGFGVVMPKAPAAFFHTVAAMRLPRDLAWAYNATACRFAGLTPATPVTAARVLISCAAAVDVWHRHGVAGFDFSGTNELWDPLRGLGYFLDCDSLQVLAEPRGLPRAESPGWRCPWPDTGIEADCYKLALMVLRVVHRYEGPLDDSVARIRVGGHPRQGIPRALVDLLRDGLRRDGPRPSAADWLPVLRDLEAGLRARRAA